MDAVTQRLTLDPHRQLVRDRPSLEDAFAKAFFAYVASRAHTGAAGTRLPSSRVRHAREPNHWLNAR